MILFPWREKVSKKRLVKLLHWIPATIWRIFQVAEGVFLQSQARLPLN